MPALAINARSNALIVQTSRSNLPRHGRAVHEWRRTSRLLRVLRHTPIATNFQYWGLLNPLPWHPEPTSPSSKIYQIVPQHAFPSLANLDHRPLKTMFHIVLRTHNNQLRLIKEQHLIFRRLLLSGLSFLTVEAVPGWKNSEIQGMKFERTTSALEFGTGDSGDGDTDEGADIVKE